MTVENRYYKRSRINEKKFKAIVRCFSTDLSAPDTAKLTGISINVTTIFLRLRRRIGDESHSDLTLDNKYGANVPRQDLEVCFSFVHGSICL